MRLLSWIVGLPVAVVVLLFALSNRQEVTVALWPFEDGVALPMFLAVLAPLLLGFLLGLLLTGWRAWRYRAQARSATRRVALLEGEIATAQTAAQVAAGQAATASVSTPPAPPPVPGNELSPPR